MTQEEWKEAYIARFMECADLTREEAEECYAACEQPIDLTDDPTDSADTEMSYWDEPIEDATK